MPSGRQHVRCGQLRSESDHAGKRRRPRPYVNEEFTITNDFFTALPVLILSARLAVSLRPLKWMWLLPGTWCRWHFAGENYGRTSGNTDLKHRFGVLMNRRTHCQCPTRRHRELAEIHGNSNRVEMQSGLSSLTRM